MVESLYSHPLDISTKAANGSSPPPARPREPGKVEAGARRRDGMDPGAAIRVPTSREVGVAGGAPLQAQALNHICGQTLQQGPPQADKKGGTASSPIAPYGDEALFLRGTTCMTFATSTSWLEKNASSARLCFTSYHRRGQTWHRFL